MIKIYQKNIIFNYFKNIITVSLVFLCLSFVLNILEEISFFKDSNVSIKYPILVTFLNVPSILYELFPFIILISTQLFFLNSFNRSEIIIYKNFGLANLNIIFIITLFSFIVGVFLNTVFYTFSSELKHSYLTFKNKFTNDNKYLAVINENGLWIKDEVGGNINIINASQFKDGSLENLNIIQLKENFDFINSINSRIANIDKNEWILTDVTIYETGIQNKSFKSLKFYSNFDREKIDNLFSNLSSRNLYELFALKKDYDDLGYSTLEIKSYIYKTLSLPLYLSIMALIGALIMYSSKYNKSKIFVILVGIISSVIIYYFIYFSNLLGVNENFPIALSIFMPYILLFLASSVGLVGVNEK